MAVNLVVELQNSSGEKIAENFFGSLQGAKAFAKDNSDATIMKIHNVDTDETTYYVKSATRWTEASPNMAKYIANRSKATEEQT